MNTKIPTAGIFGILSLTSQTDSWGLHQLAGWTAYVPAAQSALPSSPVLLWCWHPALFPDFPWLLCQVCCSPTGTSLCAEMWDQRSFLKMCPSCLRSRGERAWLSGEGWWALLDQQHPLLPCSGSQGGFWGWGWLLLAPAGPRDWKSPSSVFGRQWDLGSFQPALSTGKMRHPGSGSLSFEEIRVPEGSALADPQDL